MTFSSPPDSLARLKDVWSVAVETEVQKRLNVIFNENDMILAVPRLAIPKGAELCECYQTEKEWIIVGMPAQDDEGHDCDAMGCSTLSHVVARIPRGTGTANTPILQPALHHHALDGLNNERIV